MRNGAWLPLVCVALALGCVKEKPFAFEQPVMGISATFPGEPLQGIYPEDTPYGRIQWRNFSYTPPGRMDQNFHIDVGSLPPGDKGGDTVPVALASFQTFLAQRLGATFTRTELAPSRGQGFQYGATSPTGARIEGVVILKGGRLYHAQGTVAAATDPRLRTFLDSFAVRP